MMTGVRGSTLQIEMVIAHAITDPRARVRLRAQDVVVIDVGHG